MNHKLIIFFRTAWRVLFSINFLITFLLLYPFFLIFIQFESCWKIVFVLKRFWAKMIVYNVGIRVKIRDEAHLDKKGTYVFCSNHTSYLDTVSTYLATPIYFHFMGKAELLKVPMFRIFFWRMDIPVDRTSRIGSHKAFNRASSDLKKGISIAIFPEGTIHNTAPKLHRFKNGPFKLAIENQVPIVPITFKNNWVILPNGRKAKKGGRPARMQIVIHKPIKTQGMTDNDIDKLKLALHDIINNELRK